MARPLRQDRGTTPVSIHHSLKSLLLNEKFADLTLRCGGQDFRAHRAIVCPQSTFLDAACDGGFKESTTGVIELPEDDPDILTCVLQFLYTGNYEDGVYYVGGEPAFVSTLERDEVEEALKSPPGTVTGGLSEESQRRAGLPTETDPNGDEDYPSPTDSELDRVEDDEPEEEYLENPDGVEDFDVQSNTETDLQFRDTQSVSTSLFTSLRVYIMADKFDIPTLKLLARDRFYNAATEAYGNCEDFATVVNELYESTLPSDTIIRDIPCRLIASNCGWTLPLPADIEAVMRKHGDLAVGVLNYSALYWANERCRKCEPAGISPRGQRSPS